MIPVLAFDDQQVKEGTNLKMVIKDKKERDDVVEFTEKPSAVPTKLKRPVHKVVSDTMAKLIVTTSFANFFLLTLSMGNNSPRGKTERLEVHFYDQITKFLV